MAYILMVEDDVDFAETVATVLTAQGNEVQTLSETGGVLDSLRQRRPDLIILDVMFPEDPSAGFRLARTLHGAESEFKEVPILMMTAVNTRFPLGFGPDDRDEAWMPVSDFLEKPVDLGLLEKKVNALLARASE